VKKRPPDTQNKSGRPPTTLRRDSGEATQGKLRCSLSDRVVNAAAGKSGFPPALVARPRRSSGKNGSGPREGNSRAAKSGVQIRDDPFLHKRA
jgi:hypothetical protein